MYLMHTYVRTHGNRHDSWYGRYKVVPSGRQNTNYKTKTRKFPCFVGCFWVNDCSGDKSWIAFMVRALEDVAIEKHWLCCVVAFWKVLIGFFTVLAVWIVSCFVICYVWPHYTPGCDKTVFLKMFSFVPPLHTDKIQNTNHENCSVLYFCILSDH